MFPPVTSSSSFCSCAIMESRSHVRRNGDAEVTGEFLNNLTQLFSFLGEMYRLTFVGVDSRPDSVTVLGTIAVNVKDNSAGQFGKSKPVLDAFN